MYVVCACECETVSGSVRIMDKKLSSRSKGVVIKETGTGLIHSGG